MSETIRKMTIAAGMTTLALLISPKRADAYECSGEMLTCKNEGGYFNPGAQLCLGFYTPFISFSIGCETNFECEFAGHPEWNWGGWCS